MEESRAGSEARSPSGKAKVCKTFIGGSIPPRASKAALLQGRLEIPRFFTFSIDDTRPEPVREDAAQTITEQLLVYSEVI
jgi:hypothetical protein